MSGPTTARTSTAARRLPAPVPPGPEMTSTYLSPADPFPSTLAELELVELHVLHSRIARQLDREYCTAPDGSHPVTLDRAQELVAELDTRQQFLATTAPAYPAAPRATARGGRRGAATASQAAAAPPRPAGKRGGGPSRARKEALSDPTLQQAEPPILDLEWLRLGDQIEVWSRGQLQCVGTVEEAAPSLGVVWIREALDGYRRIVHTQDTELRRHFPDDLR